MILVAGRLVHRGLLRSARRCDGWSIFLQTFALGLLTPTCKSLAKTQRALSKAAKRPCGTCSLAPPAGALRTQHPGEESSVILTGRKTQPCYESWGSSTTELQCR